MPRTRSSTSSPAAAARSCNRSLASAAARGEAREHVPERVARLPLDLIRHELILTHRSPSSETLEEIVDQIFLPLVTPAG